VRQAEQCQRQAAEAQLESSRHSFDVSMRAHQGLYRPLALGELCNDANHSCCAAQRVFGFNQNRHGVALP
jgi:hypothetical protein